MSGYRFEEPWALLALLLIPATMLWRRWRGRTAIWLVPYAGAWTTGSGWRRDWRIVLLYAALALLVVALARPQRLDARHETRSRGYDLMLAVDLSSSMLAEDYAGSHGPINRLEAVRPVLSAFITGRPHDRIGVVLFARRAYTLAPLTTDHRSLERQVAELRIGLIDDGTAIGDGLGMALANLETGRGSQRAVGAFVILLTDGANTSGTLTPPEATAIARHRGVPVYTIAAGRNGMVPFPVFDERGRRTGTRQQPSSLDLEALRAVSVQTGGRMFEAGDARAVRNAFAAIDAARKAEFQVKVRRTTTELFHWAALPALGCLVLAFSAVRLARPDARRAP